MSYSIRTKKNNNVPVCNVSERTIKHRIQKDLNLLSCRAIEKLLLTDAMITKSLTFVCKYQSWTPEQWNKVMFSVKVHLNVYKRGMEG
jgi:hypothetical protein